MYFKTLTAIWISESVHMLLVASSLCSLFDVMDDLDKAAGTCADGGLSCLNWWRLLPL